MAINKLKEKHRNIKLLITGSGVLEKEVKEYIAEHKLNDYVQLTGWVNNEDLYKFYSAVDFFIGPSKKSSQGWIEAFGITFAEAMACETPVITTTTGGTTDFAIEGENAFLAEAGDIESLISAMNRAISLSPKDRKEFGKRGRLRIVNNHSWDIVADKYEKLYKKSINK